MHKKPTKLHNHNSQSTTTINHPPPPPRQPSNPDSTHNIKPIMANLCNSKPTTTHHAPYPLRPRPTTRHPAATISDSHPSTSRSVKTRTTYLMRETAESYLGATIKNAVVIVPASARRL
ncbi:hypothetical protein CMV_000217 [Castanea mollissima]|uniref:Uncharacterized protein n=1 Tax=Castanea mollissima TaxID=60419 RepID=A0A8J4S5L7_9ROSI|nr:hypothetical protein CMV_000217 [Castanea mollissima]